MTSPALSTKNPRCALPLRVDSAILSKHHAPGEPWVVLKMEALGTTTPYEYRGHGGRAFVFRWDWKRAAHLLKVPLGLWTRDGHRLAHDVLDHHRLPAPMVVMVEEDGKGEVEEGKGAGR